MRSGKHWPAAAAVQHNLTAAHLRRPHFGWLICMLLVGCLQDARWIHTQNTKHNSVFLSIQSLVANHRWPKPMFYIIIIAVPFRQPILATLSCQPPVKQWPQLLFSLSLAPLVDRLLAANRRYLFDGPRGKLICFVDRRRPSASSCIIISIIFSYLISFFFLQF